MAKKNPLIKTQFKSGLDYDDMARVFSKASNSKVTWERKGNWVYFDTDKDPEEVYEALINKASENLEALFDVIFQAIAFEASGVREWEKNARLN